TFSRSGTIQWASLTPETPFLGDPRIVDALALPNTPDPLLTSDLASGITSPSVPPFNPAFYDRTPPDALGQNVTLGVPWDHLIYAMLMENTGVFEILAEVVGRYVLGEPLEVPSLKTEQ